MSSLSEAGGPDQKRRRISSSSLSDQGETSEEDKPLASRGTTGTKTRPDGTVPMKSSKKGTSGLGVAHIVPREGDSVRPPALKIKTEQDSKIDSGQLDRLISGVTVDVTSAADDVLSHAPPLSYLELTVPSTFLRVHRRRSPRLLKSGKVSSDSQWLLTTALRRG